MSSRLRATIDRDSGAVAVMVALLVTFIILPVAAVGVDLSSAYSNRRQMQNAADAAAQAGAQVMAKGASTTASAIETAAAGVATENGITTTDPGYSCEVVKVTYLDGEATASSPASCSAWMPGAGYNAVRVNTARSVDTFFAPALGLVDGGDGVETTSARARAVAAVQRVDNASLGNAVFAACAFSNTNRRFEDEEPLEPLLVEDAGEWLLNDDAIGDNYIIWSSGGANSGLSDCALGGESFNGLICGMDIGDDDCVQPIELPATLSIKTGVVTGPTVTKMAGYNECVPSAMQSTGTKVNFSPCAMVLPVCQGSNGLSGDNARLDCAKFGAFLLSPGEEVGLTCSFVPSTNQNTICGRFLGAPQPLGGAPVLGDPADGDAFRVALVQ